MPVKPNKLITIGAEYCFVWVVLGFSLDFLMWENPHLFPPDINYFGEQFTSARTVGLYLRVRMLFHYQNTSLCTSEQACLAAEEKITKKDRSSVSEV